MKIQVIVPNISNPYLGPSAVAYNILRGFIKIQELLEKNDVKLSFLSINDCVSRKLTPNIKITGSLRYPPATITGELQALINETNEKPDVVHSHLLYEIFPFLFRTKTVFTLHGVFWKEFHFKNNLYNKMYCLLAEARLKLIYPRLTKFIAISPYVVQEISSKNFDITKAVVIENPVADDFFDVSKKDDNMILYPAAMVPRKNQLRFLGAVSVLKKELQDYKIVFTGSGDRSYFEELKHYIYARELKNIEFLGKVPYYQMLELYSRASMVVLTSLQETLPMACLESLATGTPVIASRVGGIPYIIKNGINGLLVNPWDTKDIAQSIQILTDKNTRKKLGENAKKDAERFRSETIARKHLELYLSC